MKKLPKLIIFILLTLDILLVGWLLLHTHTIAVLQPQGQIALEERNLIFAAVSIMLLVAIPILLLTFFIAWKYRADNPKATYRPDWTGNLLLKCTWWGILSVLVLVFWIIVWNSAHKLDPYKPIEATTKPITIQVVAMRWKWLFIYPEQHIATVNFMQFPVHTPVNFKLTADDAPMNSFWIPQLGGQMYAMTTMETKLHLIANTTGDFSGGAAEINGSGFAGMRFIARSSLKDDFDNWVEKIKKSSKPLDAVTYNTLVKPSEDNPVTYYSSVDNNLYNTIIMKDMMPVKNNQSQNSMPGMDMKGMYH